MNPHSDALSCAPNVPGLALDLVECPDPQRWDRFVDSQPDSRFCHLWGYRRALEDTYGFNCVYLEIQNQGRLVGVFPSVLVKRQQRQILLSQPFVEYGGPLCSQFTIEDYVSLAEALSEAARERNCERVLIRGGVGAENLDAFKHCSRTVLQSYGELHLEGTEDDIWNRHLSQKARNAVRSASKSGLRCEIHRGFNACQPPFYDLYLRSMKRLCVPPHTPRFFEALAAHLGEGLVSCWAYQGTQPVAVILGGITAPRLHCIIMASDERAWPLHPNDLIHWKLIEWALDQGIERLDLGSASSRKQLDFKRKWGAEMRDYAYLSINVSGQPETPESNREHVLQKKLWSLLPLRASSIIGPILRKRIY